MRRLLLINSKIQAMIEQVHNWSRFYLVDRSYRALLDSPRNCLDYLFQPAYQQACYKHDRTTTVVLVKWQNKQLVVKRYNARNQWHKVKRALRRSRAYRCWKMSQRFCDAGLNVAPAILMQEQRWGPLRGDAYFVNQYLEGDTVLDALPKMDTQQQQSLKQAVLKAFSFMKQHRITHGDMKASNLIWSQNKLFFIDLDAAQQHRTYLSWQWSYKKDVKRFLKNWHGQSDLLDIFDELIK